MRRQYVMAAVAAALISILLIALARCLIGLVAELRRPVSTRVDLDAAVSVLAGPELSPDVISRPLIDVSMYDVPLDEGLLRYVCQCADDYEVPRELVLGVMWAESGYNPEASSYGLMGIKADACVNEMQRCGATDLLDPYQNAMVGILVLADKLDTYDTVAEALMAYNAGNHNAHKFWFSKGIYSTEYSQKVLAEAERVLQG